MIDLHWIDLIGRHSSKVLPCEVSDWFSIFSRWVFGFWVSGLKEKMKGFWSGGEEKPKRDLEGTGLNLPVNRHGNLKSTSSDQNLKEILQNIRSSKSPAVINYGASWCHICSQILPAFCQLSNEFPKLSFVYADIDECPETTQHIRYTPTFHFFRDGERVDEMLGAGEERLHDRLWLHS